MSAKNLIASEVKILGSALATVDNNTAQVNFDLNGGSSGTDLYLPSLANFDSADRLVVVFVGHRTSGTTSKVTYNVWDAPGTSAAAGSFALALGSGGYAAGGDSNDTVTNTAAAAALQSAATGHYSVVVGVQLQSDRPWLRCSLVLDDGTDVFTSSCLVLAIPGGL